MAEPYASRSNEDDLIVSFGDIPLWGGVQKNPGVHKSYPLEISVQHGPIMQCTSPDVIKKVVEAYQSEEYQFITAPPGASNWANALGESKFETLTEVLRDCKKPKKILEIGAGSTWVASKVRDRYQPDFYTIVDPTVQSDVSDIEIIREYFPCDKIAGRRFDLVIGFSVLEHVPDPIIFLNHIKEHLEDDGKVILVYPDCEDQIRRGDINVLIHEHLSYFTNTSSHWLAETCGFKVDSLRTENDCFTMELSLINEQKAVIALDESALLHEGVERFRSLFGVLKENIVRYLESGKTVGFHGATNGLNTFLHISKLGDHPNIYIYDGDTLKQGFYLPACISCIKSPEDASYSSHALMVISALSFYDQIFKYCMKKTELKASQLMRLEGFQE